MFAIAMSDLLYQMRIESDTPYGDNDCPVPEDFALSIVDDVVHTVQMKKRIKDSILDAITRNPLLYMENGTYSYHPDCFDHAMAIDAYVDEMYDDTQTKCVYLCMNCQSDAVQVKSWTRPNEGQKFVDEIEGDEMGWCDDCKQTVEVQTAELKKRARVVGYQVVGDDGTPEGGNIHPHMDASFCLYSLDQARSMMDDNDNGNEQWRLLTIWHGDVEDPTFMFEGDPRNPESIEASNGTNGLF